VSTERGSCDTFHKFIKEDDLYNFSWQCEKMLDC
jgi:hypothetical protein